MKKPNSNYYDRNNTYTDSPDRLPTDQAYVVKIKEAKEVVTEGSWGTTTKLAIAFDIVEGEYANYYTTRFKADAERNKDTAKYKGVVRFTVPNEDGSDADAYRIKSWNSNLVAVEDSNPGYSWDWDETKLAGKLVGLVLRDKEYEYNGQRGFWSEPFKFITVENAREQKFRAPKAKLLSNTSAADSDSSFVNVPEGINEEVPFL